MNFRRVFPVVLLCVVTALSHALLFHEEKSKPLWPDATGYVELAQSFRLTHFYAASTREPFWIATVHVWQLVFGTEAPAQRLLTAFLSLLMVLQLYRLLARLHGERRALVGALILASSPWQAFIAVQCHREQLTALLLLVMIDLLLTENLSRGRIVAAAGVAAALALTRWEMLYFLLPATVVRARFTRRGLVVWAQAAALALALIAPFPIANALEYGDPLYHHSRHAVAMRNTEFAGQADVPADSELARNRYAGAHAGWGSYLTRFSLADNVWRFSTGWTILVVRLAYHTFMPSSILVDHFHELAYILAHRGSQGLCLALLWYFARGLPAAARDFRWNWSLALVALSFIPYGHLAWMPTMPFHMRIVIYALPVMILVAAGRRGGSPTPEAG